MIKNSGLVLLYRLIWSLTVQICDSSGLHFIFILIPPFFLFFFFSFLSLFLPPHSSEQGLPLPEEDLGDSDQRLALHVIKNKCNFVPEHVEERTLYNPVTPHIPVVGLIPPINMLH